MEMLVALVDLLSLELDEELHVDVRCTNCNSKIGFRPHHVDPMSSQFYCTSKYYCGNTWTKFVVLRNEPKLHHWFYVGLSLPKETSYVLEIVHDVGTTAFHRLREASTDEQVARAEAAVQVLRQKVRKKLGGTP